MNYIKLLENYIKEVKDIDIKELKQDIEYLEKSGYDTSYLAVQQSVERVVHYLRKYKYVGLAKVIEDTYINGQRRISLHACLISLIKEIREIEGLESDILDYIYEQYKGTIYDNPFLAYRVRQARKTKKDITPLRLHHESKTLLTTKIKINRYDVTKLLRQSELEVLLLSTLLFSSNRAYIGKIDKYIEKHDSVMFQEELRSIIEADHD